jgi:hypothetical protein
MRRDTTIDRLMQPPARRAPHGACVHGGMLHRKTRH